MSTQAAFVFGFFSVNEPPVSVVTKSKTGASLHHWIIKSEILSTDSLAWPVEIRVYAPQNSTTFPQFTVLFVFGRIAFLPASNHDAIIDAIFALPFGGDPTHPMYDDPIPTRAPVITLIGHVKTKSELADNGTKRVFRLSTSEYVRDAQQAFEAQVAFNLTKARWANAPSPFVNTCIEVAGPLLGYDPTDGVIRIEPEHLCLNLSSLSVASAAAAPSAPSSADIPSTPIGKSPAKRKFGGNASIMPSKKPRAVSTITTPSTPSSTGYPSAGVQSSPIDPSMAFPGSLPPFAALPFTRPPFSSTDQPPFPDFLSSNNGVGGSTQHSYSAPNGMQPYSPQAVQYEAGPSQPHPSIGHNAGDIPPSLPMIESGVRPPLRNLSAMPHMARGSGTGITIRDDPNAHLTARQKSKRPDTYINPNLE
ncbi:hypothetical protein FRB94_012351 [Tulasnella sp. JGI-2019a]|nr:hypothetical protein FRB94_012351 [Tulasnella sp. JGI-2019a]